VNEKFCAHATRKNDMMSLVAKRAINSLFTHTNTCSVLQKEEDNTC